MTCRRKCAASFARFEADARGARFWRPGIYIATRDGEHDGYPRFSIVRLNPDGTQDPDYAPARQLLGLRIAGVSPDGTLFWSHYSPEAEFFPFCATAPSGETRELARYPSQASQVLRLPNDRLAVARAMCNWFGTACSEAVEILDLSSGATENPVVAMKLDGARMPVSLDVASFWSLVGDEIQITAWPESSSARSIGLPGLVDVQFGSDLTIRLRRSGSTDTPASVRVRVTEAGSDSAPDVADMELPALSGDPVFAVPIPEGPQSPREFEVELVSVPDGFSAFGTKQRILWIAPTRTPGKLRLLQNASFAVPGSLLLLFEDDLKNSPKSYRMDSGTDLGRWELLTYILQDSAPFRTFFPDPDKRASYFRLAPSMR